MTRLSYFISPLGAAIIGFILSTHGFSWWEIGFFILGLGLFVVGHREVTTK